jgi:hypothetical protein
LDRREWLTTIYREANVFVQNNPKAIADITSNNMDIDEIKPALEKQLKSILVDAESLEDFVKFSLLRDPDPAIWQQEATWERALISVATECLSYDVLGIVVKLIDGELPRTDPLMIHDFDPHQKIPVHDDTTQRIKQGMPGEKDEVDDMGDMGEEENKEQ